MRSLQTRVAALTAQLAAATGHQPRKHSGNDRIRVEVDVDDGLTEAAQSTILTALADADRYGHDRRPDGAVVWAELIRRN